MYTALRFQYSAKKTGRAMGDKRAARSPREASGSSIAVTTSAIASTICLHGSHSKFHYVQRRMHQNWIMKFASEGGLLGGIAGPESYSASSGAWIRSGRW